MVAWSPMLWWLFLLSCEPEPDQAAPESPADEPWRTLAPIALDPFFLAYETTPLPTTATTRLLSVPGQPALAAFPRDDGAASLLDARYQLQRSPACIEVDQFPDVDDGIDRSEACGEGYVSVDRGTLGAGLQVVDIAFDAAARELVVLDQTGNIRRANTDITVGNPYDLYRLGPASQTTCGTDIVTAILPDELGSYWLAAGTTLCEVAADGTPIAEHELDWPVQRLVRVSAHTAALTPNSVWLSSGVELSLSGGADIDANAAGNVYVSVPAQGMIQEISAVEGLIESFTVASLTGPLATDLRTGKVYVAVADGVAVVESGTEIARYQTAEVADLVVNDSHEIIVLGRDTVIHVYMDETALLGSPPLPVWIAAFIENPRRIDDKVDCSGSDEGMEERVEFAHANRHFLDNTPATTSIAITPAVSVHAARCDQLDELQHVVDRARTETGVLLHDAPEDCTGQACIAETVNSDLNALQRAKISVDFLAGGQGLEFTGDWVKALVESDAPPIYTFFGMWVFSHIGVEDPRAKDAWPWDTEASTATWRASTATTAAQNQAEGELLFLPGGTLAGFNYDSCAGLLQVECRFADGGGQSTFSESDGKLLGLAIRRAAAHRPSSGGASWSFHLPAIEAFDYLEGCDETDGIWSGESCQAAVIQAWTFDVNARLVQNGVAVWSLPSLGTGPL